MKLGDVAEASSHGQYRPCHRFGTVVNLPGSVFFIPLKGLCVVHNMLQREGRTSVHCCRKARPASAVFQESLIMNDFASTEL